MRRDERMVGALLAHGADANARFEAGRPRAARRRTFTSTPELVGATPFWLAARFAGAGVMRQLWCKPAPIRLFVHHGERVVDGPGGTAFRRGPT